MADNTVQFRALQLANEHRTAYGLRYNDYARYRKHCGNRTHRLRSTLKMTHGKGREFKKLPPLKTDTIKEGHLELLLFESERAWSYSQELLVASHQPANSEKSATLHHSATGRFRRAVHWSTQLLSHCQALWAAKRFSAENLLEITAYTLILNGRFLRDREEFEDALEQLSVASDLLDTLANTAQTSRDQALATVYSDQISPEIRHCAHELGHSKSYDVENIVKEIAPKKRTQLVADYTAIVQKLHSEKNADSSTRGRSQLKKLVWEGQEVPIRNPELVDVLINVQEAESRLDDVQHKLKSGADTQDRETAKIHKSRKGVAIFDGILSALSDAEDVARKLAEAHQASGSTSSEVGVRDIQFVYSFIVYQLLSRRIQRDLALISALVSTPIQSSSRAKQPVKKESSTDARVNPAVVKLLDTVLQSLSQMRTLSVVDESPDLGNLLESRMAYTKSRKCLFLARSYSVVKKYAEALSLTQRAHLYLREATSFLPPESVEIPASQFYPLSSSTISELEGTLDSEETQLKRDWFAYNHGSVSSERDASKKPLFFDIALNYVQLDMDRLHERAGKKPPPPPVSVSVKTPEPKAAPQTTRTKMAAEIERAATPEPEPEPARGGLSSLLGGWWGRR